ncbi:MAG: hypothetical protein Salg2KO_11400 [Salibacteraceae bacterium]
MLLLIAAFTIVFRVSKTTERETTWDVLGYYLYLPATFIHADPMLDNIDWIEKANENYKLTGTIYQLSYKNKNGPMYFFLMGMALFYLPFFILGHLLTIAIGGIADGFSPIYQYTLVAGGIFYTLLGVFLVLRILNHSTKDRSSALALGLFFFGTNMIQHLAYKNLETVNILFLLSAGVLWHSIRLYETKSNRHFYWLSLFIGLAVLVKPSEGVLILIPTLWGASNLDALKSQLRFFWEERRHILLAGIIPMLLAMPQLLYWYIKTGSPIVDSYVNAGVGLDFWNPHLMEVLFSYRKGWFVYTPLIIFSVIGLGFLIKKIPGLGWPILIFCLFELWVIASWTEWWYGAAFSCRPMVITYPFLMLSFAWLLSNLKNRFIKGAVIGLSSLMAVYGAFKWWQFSQFIVHPSRMTKEAYWDTMFDTEKVYDKERLMLVNRSDDGNSEMQFPSQYIITSIDSIDSKGNVSLPYHDVFKRKFSSITTTDHAWIEFSLDFIESELDSASAFMVFTAVGPEGDYGYIYHPIQLVNGHYEKRFLTPEMRYESDLIHAYIWVQNKSKIQIEKGAVIIYERQ